MGTSGDHLAQLLLNGDHLAQFLLEEGQLEQIAQGHVQLMLSVSKDGGSVFHSPLWAACCSA